mmetsp:Transcript_47834/g.145474  ORF Transcript_47834/g.145474 Transcript_47834/m.145474 type:complete len:202 (+) Transcript_47834:443-1048(+)
MPCWWDSKRPKNTASKSWPWASMRTADTSRSHSPSSTSQPRPTVMRPKSMGKSKTLPFSIANATFCRCGAEGMNCRMTCDKCGRTSMKCRPSCAGVSTSRIAHLPCRVRYMTLTTSTWPVLSRFMSKTEISRRSSFSKTWTRPFATSPKEPPEKAATTKTSKDTFGGTLWTFTQTISSILSGFPEASSPECVTARPAFKLL